MSIILYANHACPWCHRVYIALVELGLEFEEVLIDLDKPRELWYLEINPVLSSPPLLADWVLIDITTTERRRTVSQIR